MRQLRKPPVYRSLCRVVSRQHVASRIGTASLICTIALSILFSALFAASAFAAEGDYDGDGLSDLSAAQVGPGVTAWISRASSGAASPYYVWNGVADALVGGRYFHGDFRSYPGAVFSKGTEPLSWHIKHRFSGESVIRFGATGDSIPNQGDVDCDGITDFIVARNGSGANFPGFKLWYVATSSKPGYVQQLLFGLAGDQVGTSDMDGDGCSELVLFRGDYTWFSRKLFNDFVSQAQWGSPGDIPLLPKDFNGDGAADYVVSRVTGTTQTALIRLSNGNFEAVPLGFSTSVPMTGSFIGLNFFAWVERLASAAAILQFNRTPFVFPFANPSNTIIRPDGTVVYPQEFPWDGGIDQTVGAAVPGTPSLPTSGGISCDAQLKRNDGSGGFVNNPKSSRHSLKLIFPESFTGAIAQVQVWYNGAHYETLYLGGKEYGNRERYYGKKDINSYPDGIQIVLFHRNGTKHCTVLEDPQRRYE